MTLMESFISALGNSLTIYSYLLSFVAPLLGGEISIMTLAFLSSQGYFPIWIVIVFGFAGMFLLDAFWFKMARSNLANKLKNSRRVFSKYEKLEKRLEKMTHQQDFLILLFAKVLVGTRIIMLIYMSSRKISFKKFLMYNSVPTLIWMNCLVLIGWFAGRGYSFLIETFRDIQIGISFLLITSLLIYLFGMWINNKILKRANKSEND